MDAPRHKPRRRETNHQMEYSTFLGSLRERRFLYGYTQAMVAKGINVSRSQYTALESGRSMLSFNQLSRLASFFGVETWRLVKGLD